MSQSETVILRLTFCVLMVVSLLALARWYRPEALRLLRPVVFGGFCIAALAFMVGVS